MRLLITNDDGVHAKGIHALCKELEKYHDIIIVAPDDQRSATSHSITISKPLVVKEVELPDIKSKAYSVSGTPADCVRVATDQIIKDKVDMVVSGINIGYNLGTDILYSGTVSAAVEATLCSVPAIAVSTESSAEDYVYENAAKYIKKVIEVAVSNKLHEDIVLNVNVPPIKDEEIKGIKVCKIGKLQFHHYYKETGKEKENLVYKLEGERVVNHVEETDSYYVDNGYVTVTPLHYDLTNFNILKDVGKWF
ncbi:5'/3'-nucleotidase SurE [Vallitalea guaymasensis]|uniref:5'/3'-nucleotidase SurE n=1 Tax=Vallitalea guaymasensis TaxID=1185412 RepID=UPI00235489F2|nr:5'/3'-nucleotidase SurE [Vallitalea guaymasensis]